MSLRQLRGTIFRISLIISSIPYVKTHRVGSKIFPFVMAASATASTSSKKLHDTELYRVELRPDQWSIVYSPQYNINAYGLQSLHLFDAEKWGRVFQMIKEADMVTDETVVAPKEASQEDLEFVHTKKYLDDLRWSSTVAKIVEVLPVAFIPNFILQKILLRPMRYQTGGTILAADLAMQRGWAINIGGGFHHAHSEGGGGFCVYADITLAIKLLMAKDPKVKKAMIIDLDAHQGNGHERDFLMDDSVYILDVYNGAIYPRDFKAKEAINKRANCLHHTKDDEYLEKVKRTIEEALTEFSPDIVIYNAGTDILINDPLGKLDITAEGIIQRDLITFTKVRAKNIPIVMVTSGGYTRETARIIADSILNLKKNNLIAIDDNSSRKFEDIYPPQWNEDSYDKDPYVLRKSESISDSSDKEKTPQSEL